MYGHTYIFVNREHMVDVGDVLTLTFLSLHFIQESNWREFTRLELLSGSGGGADWGSEGP